MTEKFEITVEWFFPTDKENRVHGVLTYDPQDGTAPRTIWKFFFDITIFSRYFAH